MSAKTIYYLAALIGSIVGSFIPAIWGGSLLSMSSLFLGALGGILGVVIVYKLLN